MSDPRTPEEPSKSQQKRIAEQSGDCDHRWKYETFYHVIGDGPAQDIYRCSRCLRTKRVPNYSVIGD